MTAITATVPNTITETIFNCARGSYQNDLLTGWENWSGSSLQGAARKWGARYAESRRNLMRRIDAALEGTGYMVSTELVLDGVPKRWRRELILWTPAGDEIRWSSI